MNILQICSNYYPSLGGIEIFVENLSKELVKNGHRVSVLTYSHGDSKKRERIDGIDVYRIKPLATFSSQQITFSLKKKLRTILDEVRPDIIHFHYPNPLLSNALLSVIKQTNYMGKLYVHWHGDIVGRKLIKRWYTKSTNKLVKRADKISSDTFNYAKFSPFLKEHLDKVFVIPAIPDKRKLESSGIDETSKRFIIENSENKIAIFGFGRFVKWKGFSFLIDAMKYLDKDKYVLFLGGYGKYESHLRKLVQTDNIHFVGKLDDSKKYTYLSFTDIYVFPSIGRQEAFGITLAEGMCLGKIPILFDKMDLGAREIAIPNHSCLCAKEITSEALAKTIEEYSALPTPIKDKMIKNISKIIEEKMTVKVFNDCVEKFYS